MGPCGRWARGGKGVARGGKGWQESSIEALKSGVLPDDLKEPGQGVCAWGGGVSDVSVPSR